MGWNKVPSKVVPAILAALEEDSMTRAQICAEIGFSTRQVRDKLGVLVLEEKVHISGWHHNYGTGGHMAAIYTLGKGKNKPPVKIKKDGAYHRAYRERAGIAGFLKRRKNGNSAADLAKPIWIVQLLHATNTRTVLKEAHEQAPTHSTAAPDRAAQQPRDPQARHRRGVLA